MHTHQCIRVQKNLLHSRSTFDLLTFNIFRQQANQMHPNNAIFKHPKHVSVWQPLQIHEPYFIIFSNVSSPSFGRGLTSSFPPNRKLSTTFQTWSYTNPRLFVKLQSADWQLLTDASFSCVRRGTHGHRMTIFRKPLSLCHPRASPYHGTKAHR